MELEHIVSLEIGTSRIRVLVAEPHDEDHLSIIGTGETASRGVRKGEIIDIDNALACLRSALHNAEKNSGRTIREVYLLLSGGMVQGIVNRGSIPLVDGGEITGEDLDHVMDAARAVSLPTDRDVLHTICQRFLVDDQRGVVNPVGMEGHRLSVDMLILHAVRQRYRNLVKVARLAPVEVMDVAFGGLCAALAVLAPEDKKNGALVIDLGAGTTDFAAYADGAIAAAGSFAVGGDHVTNDIARGLRLPLGQAETLKEQMGCATIDLAARGQKIEIPVEGSSQPRYVRTGDLHTIVNARTEEILMLVKGAIDREEVLHHLGSGIFLTGGGAYLRGVADLAARIFGVPCMLGRPREISGLTSAAAGPEYAAPVGMLRYAIRTAGRERQSAPTGLGWLNKILRRPWS